MATDALGEVTPTHAEARSNKFPRLHAAVRSVCEAVLGVNNHFIIYGHKLWFGIRVEMTDVCDMPYYRGCGREGTSSFFSSSVIVGLVF